MQQCIVGSVDWQRRWVRSVVCCANTGMELKRAVWPRDEAEDHVAPFFRIQRETHGVPLVVTGRCRAPWPSHLLEALWREGFAVDLYDGATLGRLLRLEQRFREDQSFRSAALLAAVYLAHQKGSGIKDLPTFVLQWSTQQARQRFEELALDLESQRPQWFDDGTENLGPWQSLRPAVFSERMSVSPHHLERRQGNNLAVATASKAWWA